MPQIEISKLLKRAEKAWQKNRQWHGLLRDAYELAMPQRNLFDDRTEGEQKGDRVFDSTLQVATVRFGNRLQSNLTPPFQKWAQLLPGPFIPRDRKDEAQRILENIRDTFFAALAASNFDTSVSEFYLDLAIGTGCMIVQEGDDDVPIQYCTVPQHEVAYDLGPYGEPWGIFRRRKMMAYLIGEEWGKDFKPPEGWDRIIKDRPEREFTLHECMYFDAKERTWYYDVCLRGAGLGSRATDKEGMAKIVEREYEESPWIITPWIKIAGENRGRGPVLHALADAKVLNKVKELILKNASLAIAGVWTARDDGVLNPNTVRITPGAVISVADNAGSRGPALQALEFNGKFDVAQIIIEDLVTTIKKIMFDDQLPPDAGPVRSATEIVERIKQLSADIGAPFGRLMQFIRQVIQKSLNVLVRKGVITNTGGKLFKVDGSFINVQITSPLAQVQNLSEVQTALQWLDILNHMGPEVALLGMQVENAPEWFADRLGVSRDLVRKADERKKLQVMVGQLVARQAQTANQRVGSAPPDSGAQPPQGDMMQAA